MISIIRRDFDLQPNTGKDIFQKRDTNMTDPLSMYNKHTIQ